MIEAFTEDSLTTEAVELIDCPMCEEVHPHYSDGICEACWEEFQEWMDTLAEVGGIVLEGPHDAR